MATEILIEAQSREEAGTGPARRLRVAGRIPAVVSNEKGQAHALSLDAHAFQLMLHRHASESLILDLVVDGKKPRKVLLKEIQHHPVNGSILHVDFVEISMTRKMRADVSITLEGEAVGVVTGGGSLDQPLRSIEVECLPGDLIEEIIVDVSALDIGSHISVSELTVDPAWTVLTDGALSVVSVLAPRVEEEPAAEAEEAEGEAEGEAPEGEEAAAGEEKKEEESSS